MKNISSSLKRLAIKLLDRDADNTSELDMYTAEDVMNAVIVFNSITSNYGIHQGIISSQKKAKEFGNALHRLVLERTGVNTKTYYK